MITAERLQELINQGVTIYHISGKSIKLHLEDGNIMPTWVYGLDELFETQEQAEWGLKTTAERTEKFEPPMWKDIKDGYMFGFVNMEKHFGKTITFFVNKNGGFILIEKTGKKEPIWYEPATKENYEKACEIVRDLFNKGGAK